MKLLQKFMKLTIKIAISQSGITPLLRSFLRLRGLLRSRWGDPPATASVPPHPSGLTPGARKSGRPIAQANIQLELPEFDPKNLLELAEEFAEFLLSLPNPIWTWPLNVHC